MQARKRITSREADYRYGYVASVRDKWTIGEALQRLQEMENEEEDRNATGKRTVFEKITASPEALGSVLASLSVPEAPWDEAFREIFCKACERENCDICPNEEQRNNPLWWLETEAT